MNTILLSSDLRHLTDSEWETFKAIRLKARDMTPYVTRAIFALHPLASDIQNTFSVDARARVVINPALFNEWGIEGCASVLVHESFHILRDHFTRRAIKNADDSTYWNLAGDIEINEALVEDGSVAFPENAQPVLLKSFGMQKESSSGTAERYYDMLVDMSKKMPSPNCKQIDIEGDEFDGQDVPAFDKKGAGGLDKRQVETLRVNTAKDVKEFIGSHGRGAVPLSIQKMVDDILTPPVVDWRRRLRAGIRKGVNTATRRTKTTYSKLSRRAENSDIIPGRHGKKVRAAFVGDTSGSTIKGPILDYAASEFMSLSRSGGVSTRDMYFAGGDTELRSLDRFSVDMFSKGIKRIGNGGTSMKQVCEQVKSKLPRTDLMMLVTDGITDYPDANLVNDFIILIINAQGKVVDPTPEGATVICIKSNDIKL